MFQKNMKSITTLLHFQIFVDRQNLLVYNHIKLIRGHFPCRILVFKGETAFGYINLKKIKIIYKEDLRIMKNLKRLIALVAVFAIALTTIASAATFSDVAEDSAYYEAVETLTKLGIIDGMPDGTYAPEETVTRAQMAKLIATMQGFGATAEAGAVTKFSDVPASHWASGYIANATGKAIAGYPDGTFGPEQPVKYEQAVKMIMATLGYTVIANGEGGYPMGFISAAIKANVTDGVTNATVGTDANRGTVAQLIYNAIDTPLVEQITWNLDGNGDYIKYDGETKYGGEPVDYKSLMSEYLGVVKMKGVVTGNSYVNLYNTVTLDKDAEATIDFDITKMYAGSYKYDVPSEFLVADSNAEEFVGMAVTMFATENDYDDWEVLSIAADPTFNKTLTFDIADFSKIDGSDLYYFKDGASKATKVALAASLSAEDVEDTDVAYVYNNEVADMTTFDVLTAAKDGLYSGTVTLIDNDKYKGYDVVVIESAASAVVDSVADGIIYLETGAVGADSEEVIEIDEDDDNYYLILTKDGEEITVADVSKNDVVSVSYAAGGNVMVVDVVTNAIDGTVSSKKNSDTSAGGSAFKIDGTWYDVAAGCASKVASVKAGDAGVFYIDQFGKITHYEKSKTNGNFAYVAGYLASNTGIDGKKIEVKLLTADGVKTYTLASTVKFNGTSIKMTDMWVEDATDYSSIVGTVVNVSISGDTIKAITTAGTDEDLLDAPVSNTFSGVYSEEDIKIGSLSLDADTIVFFAEYDGATFKNSESFVGTLADLADSDSITTGYYYTTSDTVEDASIVVLENATTSVNAASGLAVIIDVSEDTNEAEEDIYTITALYNGAEVELTTTNTVYLAGYTPEIGDVVKVKVAGNNVIRDMVLVTNEVAIDRSAGVALGANTLSYTYVTNPEEVEGGAEATYDEELYYTPQANETIVAGYATAINNNSKKMTVGGEEVRLNKADNIYVIDYTGREIAIKKGSAASFKFDDRLFDLEDDGVTLVNGTKVIKVDDEAVGTVASNSDKVMDYVIYRAYEGIGIEDAFEIIIVKAPAYKLVAPSAE